MQKRYGFKINQLISFALVDFRTYIAPIVSTNEKMLAMKTNALESASLSWNMEIKDIHRVQPPQPLYLKIHHLNDPMIRPAAGLLAKMRMSYSRRR